MNSLKINDSCFNFDHIVRIQRTSNISFRLILSSGHAMDEIFQTTADADIFETAIFKAFGFEWSPQESFMPR